MERKDDTKREREKERGKKKISPRGGRGDWHSRLVEASLAANGERGFRPCVEGRWESGVERERERAAIGHGRSI